MSREIVRCLALAVLCTAPAGLHAQETATPRPPSLYLTVGAGVSDRDLLAQLGLSVDPRAGEFTLRLAGASEFTLWGSGDEVNDVALLYGIRRRNGKTWTSIGGGPAIGWRSGSECVEGKGFFGCERYETNRQSSIGLGFAASIGRSFSSAFGLSASLVGHVDSRNSFVGLAGNVNLGQLR